MNRHLGELVRRYPALSDIESSCSRALSILLESANTSGTILVCGNGGSAADADHIVGELMKGFLLPRPIPACLKEKLIELHGERGVELASGLQRGIRAISLVGHPALSTAYSNDVSSEMIFAQQVNTLARPGDVLWGISTSGNAVNVRSALELAGALDVRRILLTGADGGSCAAHAECVIRVPASHTPQIQELHLPIYHALCAALEDELYG